MSDLWVEYLGDLPVSVEQVDMWEPGRIRCVPQELALRLLTRPDFRVAEPPVLEATVESTPASKSSGRRSTATT